ncbi:uncharacterized [Tachysurus ichikawai]
MRKHERARLSGRLFPPSPSRDALFSGTCRRDRGRFSRSPFFQCPEPERKAERVSQQALPVARGLLPVSGGRFGVSPL